MKNISFCKKIMIFGRPGSGKSTFATKLSHQLRLPVYHLDRYFYTDNWIERYYQDFLNDQLQLVAGDSWIIDGNNTKSLAVRWVRADVVIYFNFPRWRCYWRIFKRLWFKDKTILDRAPGCRETIRWSLLCYMWSFEERVHEQIAILRQRYPMAIFIEVISDYDVQRVLKQLVDK